ncbi:hypothetical protein F2Q69_00057220 [Brassica cretica]|uniref:Uncharacterized protein n=1 Tax=Brassica cretica TaxID=69181 RepID=A0A8S9MM40_BRACR|nr:hypothetical protein F2Q69_00057220 [Brassica cretica]
MGAINVFDVNRHHSVELVAIVVFTVNEKGVATIWICNLNADVTATTTTNDDGVAVPKRRESTRTRRPNSRYMDSVL